MYSLAVSEIGVSGFMESPGYKRLVKVGEGAFGTIHRAFDTSRGCYVALKRLRLRDIRVMSPALLRELNALRKVDHPNVMRLLDVYAKGCSVMLVLPYVRHSLGEILSHLDAPMHEAHALQYARMLMQGLAAMHDESLLHRDIKPDNLLITPSGVLQIADMGQARLKPSDEGHSLSHAVATRWYRAPELLFGARHYDDAVDVWACGCVIAQFFHVSPLFPGESDIDQLFRVICLMGTPTLDRWPEIERLPDFHKISIPECSRVPLSESLPTSSNSLLALLDQMLGYNPRRRPRAREVLQHEWMLSTHPCTLTRNLPPATVVRPTPIARNSVDLRMGDYEIKEQRRHERKASKTLPETSPGDLKDAMQFPANSCSHVYTPSTVSEQVKGQLKLYDDFRARVLNSIAPTKIGR